ncbi:holo-ACP synthase [Peribacillus kribbensis]|uniref:holo-ACP synthase n=1 Tax=Peribacillus kribbensis TaxID=356658 RepID=UPI0003F7454F|nr:holo-ACP synthase [Peribacillus kribbensis]
MIKGIGIDLVEISRIRELAGRQPKFAGRILTPYEMEHYQSLPEKRKTEYLAGRFAAKEAYAKAAGTGLGGELSFLDIEIRKDSKGKPYIEKPSKYGVHLSITHSREYAAAQVVIEE